MDAKFDGAVLTERVATVSDPLARASVRAALLGAGAPVGVRSCLENGALLTVVFDTTRSRAELIDDVIAIAAAFAPRHEPPQTLGAVTQRAAAGLSEPDLDARRIIETYLP